MAKCDLTVGRTLTINTGNYSSIKPSVSLTLKDIDTSEVGDKFARLSGAVESLVKLEIMNLYSTMKDIEDETLSGFVETISEQFGEIEEIVNNLEDNTDGE